MITAKDIEDAVRPILGPSQVTIERDANPPNTAVVISIDHESPGYDDPLVLSVARGALQNYTLDAFLRDYLNPAGLQNAQRQYRKWRDDPDKDRPTLPRKFDQSLRGKRSRGRT